MRVGIDAQIGICNCGMILKLIQTGLVGVEFFWPKFTAPLIALLRPLFVLSYIQKNLKKETMNENVQESLTGESEPSVTHCHRESLQVGVARKYTQNNQQKQTQLQANICSRVFHP